NRSWAKWFGSVGVRCISAPPARRYSSVPQEATTMIDRRFHVVVVGSGPAGSTAAVVLARGGARVALVDKASFPREKACGDLIGPRGVQVLDGLGIAVHEETRVTDMLVVGPTGKRVRLPAAPGARIPATGSWCSD